MCVALLNKLIEKQNEKVTAHLIKKLLQVDYYFDKLHYLCGDLSLPLIGKL